MEISQFGAASLQCKKDSNSQFSGACVTAALFTGPASPAWRVSSANALEQPRRTSRSPPSQGCRPMERYMSPAPDGWRGNSPLDREANGRRMSAPRPVGDEPGSAAAAGRNETLSRVLLIEDDKETADEIRAELGDYGFDVDWAGNGVEGLDKARSGGGEAIIVH